MQTYEPVSLTYHLLEDEEEEKKGKNGGEVAQGSLLSGTDSTSYSNYRYQNCRDCYDEEDDVAFEGCDLDDEEDDDNEYDWESDIDGQRISQDGFSKQFCSFSVSSKNGISSDEVVDENVNIAMPLSVRDIHSVLSPVENLSQWRAAKAQSAPQKNQRKENVEVFQEPSIPFRSNSNFSSSPLCNLSKPLLQEIKVDSSLSSWLNSPKTHQSDTKSNRNMLETSNSWKIRGDRSVFEPTFLKAC